MFDAFVDALERREICFFLVIMKAGAQHVWRQILSFICDDGVYMQLCFLKHPFCSLLITRYRFLSYLSLDRNTLQQASCHSSRDLACLPRLWGKNWNHNICNSSLKKIWDVTKLWIEDDGLPTYLFNTSPCDIHVLYILHHASQ